MEYKLLRPFIVEAARVLRRREFSLSDTLSHVRWQIGRSKVNIIPKPIDDDQDGVLPGYANEVYWFEGAFRDGANGVAPIHLAAVIRQRRLLMTNKAYLMHPSTATRPYSEDACPAEELICQLQYETIYARNAQKAKKNNVGFMEISLQRLEGAKSHVGDWRDPVELRATLEEAIAMTVEAPFDSRPEQARTSSSGIIPCCKFGLLMHRLRFLPYVPEWYTPAVPRQEHVAQRLYILEMLKYLR